MVRSRQQRFRRQFPIDLKAVLSSRFSVLSLGPKGFTEQNWELRTEKLLSFMTEKLLGVVFVFINYVIATTGYGGIALLMAIESACIRLPSELIMPFAGYLVFHGHVQAVVGGDGRSARMQSGIAGGV
jgi:hypothetical protein